MLARLSIVALLLLPLCVGCGGDPTGRLIGSWEAEIAAPTDDSSSFAEKLSSAFASLLKVKLDMRPDGTLTFTMSVPGHDQVSNGTWKYLKSEGDVIVLEVTRDNSSNVNRVTILDNDHFELIRPGTQGKDKETLKFKRVSAPTGTSK
jgi:hypothetical protein